MSGSGPTGQSDDVGSRPHGSETLKGVGAMWFKLKPEALAAQSPKREIWFWGSGRCCELKSKFGGGGGGRSGCWQR